MSNKEVVSLERVVKSDSSVEQRVCTLFKLCLRAQEKGVESRLRRGCSRAHRPHGRFYGVVCSRRGLVGGSPIFAN